MLEKLALDDGIAFDELRLFLVLPSNEAVREAVEAGAGATVISEHVVGRAINAGVLRAVPIDLPPREFALVRHAERRATAAQHVLIDLLVPTARDPHSREAVADMHSSVRSSDQRE